MPKSRLRWRALAVLGALLSVVIDWPIGLAMPATSNSHQPQTASNNPYFSFNLTNSDRAPLSDRASSSVNTANKSGSSGSAGSSRSSKRDRTTIMPSTTLSTIERGIISNSNRSIPPERLLRVYNKRKRKKISMARVTADLLRSMRTHNNPSVSSDVNNFIINNNASNNKSNIRSESSLHNDSNSNDSDESSNNFNNLSVESTTPYTHAILDVAEDAGTSTEVIAMSPHLSRTDRSIHQQPYGYRYQNNGRARVAYGNSSRSSSGSGNNTNLDRNERSANLSHISGPARKIQLFIKNRWIQMMPDGTINGTQDDSSDYTILQRTTVDVGQIKIQGVATCLFLCMDPCGAVYGSKTFTDDCVFNESMEQHHYNTYSSTYNSNSRRTLYLALNRHGEPRRLQIPPSRPLGKLATYTKAMTSTVEEDRVEKLIARTFGANRVKHGLRQLCDAGKPLIELTTKVLRTQPKCNLLNNASGQTAAAAAPGAVVVSEKLTRIGISNSTSGSSNSHSSSSSSHNNNHNARKKKKKRKCRANENEQEHNCQRPGPQALRKRAQNRKCLPTQTPEECAAARKKGGKKNKGAKDKKRKNNNGTAANNRKSKATAALLPKSAVSATTPANLPRTSRTTSRETEATTKTTTRTPIQPVQPSHGLAKTSNLRQQLGMPVSSQEEELVSTEDSQQLHMQSSTEVHDGEGGAGDVEDEDASMSALGGQAQLVNGDDFLYDDDFDM